MPTCGPGGCQCGSRKTCRMIGGRTDRRMHASPKGAGPRLRRHARQDCPPASRSMRRPCVHGQPQGAVLDSQVSTPAAWQRAGAKTALVRHVEAWIVAAGFRQMPRAARARRARDRPPAASPGTAALQAAAPSPPARRAPARRAAGGADAAAGLAGRGPRARASPSPPGRRWPVPRPRPQAEPTPGPSFPWSGSACSRQASSCTG